MFASLQYINTYINKYIHLYIHMKTFLTGDNNKPYSILFKSLFDENHINIIN